MDQLESDALSAEHRQADPQESDPGVRRRLALLRLFAEADPASALERAQAAEAWVRGAVRVEVRPDGPDTGATDQEAAPVSKPERRAAKPRKKALGGSAAPTAIPAPAPKPETDAAKAEPDQGLAREVVADGVVSQRRLDLLQVIADRGRAGRETTTATLAFHAGYSRGGVEAPLTALLELDAIKREGGRVKSYFITGFGQAILSAWKEGVPKRKGKNTA